MRLTEEVLVAAAEEEDRDLVRISELRKIVRVLLRRVAR